jgi:hypothetical protein
MYLLTRVFLALGTLVGTVALVRADTFTPATDFSGGFLGADALIPFTLGYTFTTGTNPISIDALGNPAVPGGPLTSKPAWSNTLGCSTTSAFFCLRWARDSRSHRDGTDEQV